MSAKPEVEQHTEHEILVGEVTAHQTAWTERKRSAKKVYFDLERKVLMFWSRAVRDS